MRINKQKEDCCGCSACEQICPQNAITLVPDILGFKYPKIDNNQCIDCGLCVKVCQFKTDYDTFDVHTPVIYAFRNKDDAQLLRSQSGAAFWTLAQYVIKDGGVVYGVGYGDHFRVIHKRVTTLEDLEELRGSKYVQSDVCNTFLEARNDLNEGLKVLYSGTPCQISGLKAYIGKNLRKNLYSIDLVCHGVPSPQIWNDYFKSLNDKFDNCISKVNFRDKSKGWHAHIESYENQGRKFFFTDYVGMFYSHIMLRECCYSCPYTNFNRVSDVTIGDFWGWEKVSDLFHDNKGVSLLMVNSEKGQWLLDQVKSDAHLILSDRQSCVQRNLKSPTNRNVRRSDFEFDYAKYGYNYIINKYFNMSLKMKFKSFLKKIIKDLIRK